jgi:hypothetical protein
MSIISRVYDATIPSFSTSVAVDLGKPYAMIAIEIPSMTSNTAWNLSTSSDGNSYKKINKVINSSTLQFASFLVGSAVSGIIFDVPAGFQYYKIDVTAVVSFSAAFKIICYDTGN